jgi:hypothetical protein
MGEDGLLLGLYLDDYSLLEKGKSYRSMVGVIRGLVYYRDYLLGLGYSELRVRLVLELFVGGLGYHLVRGEGFRMSRIMVLPSLGDFGGEYSYVDLFGYYYGLGCYDRGIFNYYRDYYGDSMFRMDSSLVYSNWDCKKDLMEYQYKLRRKFDRMKRRKERYGRRYLNRLLEDH